jgi:hypothetical protein
MDSEARRIPSAIAPLVTAGADAVRIADTAVASWRDIDAALAPIIGQRGVAALFKRSLYLTRAEHPWLSAVYEGALPPGEYAPLHAALSKQAGAQAAVAQGALLQTFHDLLGNLIGAPLTERLLRPVWDRLSSGDAAQGTSP